MQKSLQHNNIDTFESTTEMRKIMQDVLSFAKNSGATDACVSVSRENGFAVDIRMGQVETLAFHESKGVGVTVYLDKRQGTASGSDTTPSALKAMVEAAIEIAKVSAPDPCFGLASRELVDNHYPDLDLFYPWDISPAEAIERAQQCEQLAIESDKRIINSDGANVSTYRFYNGHADSYGREGIVTSTRHSISCSLIAEENGAMQRDYEYSTSRHPDKLWSIDKIAGSAADRVVKRLGSRKIKTQKAPVLFSSRLSSGLIGSFIGAISGSNLYRKNSFLLDSLGAQVFPSYIRIHEQPHLKCALGSAPFDDEGVITRPNVIVNEGRVCQYVLSSFSARKLGLETTANSGGVYNLTVDATAGDLEDLLKKMDTGLLVTELMGQGVNGVTGDYSRGASGFWVQGGKIQFPVEEITIAGNLKDIFHHIVAIGTDINPNSAARCGSILVEKMMIGGE